MYSIRASMLEAYGKYSEAEPYWIKAAQSAEKERVNEYLLPRKNLIRNIINRDLYIQAEIEIRDYIKNTIEMLGKDSAYTTAALMNYGEILLNQGRLNDADIITHKAIDRRNNLHLENDLIVAESYKALFEIACAKNDFVRAIEYYEKSKEFSADENYMINRFYSRNNNLLIALLFSGKMKEAQKHLERLLEKYSDNPEEDQFDFIELKLLRGIAHAMEGNFLKSVIDYKSCINRFLDAQSEYSKSYTKKQRFRQILETYLSFFTSIHRTPQESQIGINASQEAFKLVEVLRQQSVQQALTASASRMAVQSAELSTLVRQEQDNGRMIAVLDRMLINHISMPSDQQDHSVVRDLKSQITALTVSRNTLLSEIKQKFPDYENLLNPKPADYQTLARHIRPHETLLSIFPTGQATYLWAVNDKGAVEFAVLPVGSKQIAAGVNDIRRSLDLSCDKLGDIPEFNLKLSHWFYQTFLEPVKGSWSGKKDLLIVADGPMGSLPFAVLTTQPHALSKTSDLLFSGYRHAPWLVRQVSLTRLPSVSALIGLRSLPPGDPARKAFAGFGDPIFNPEQMLTAKQNEHSTKMAQRGAQFQIRGVRITQQGSIDQTNLVSNRLSMLNRLQDTAEEVISVGQSLQADAQQDLFLGPKATEHTVRSLDLSNRRVVYFATHALVPGDIDGLHEPALALSSPEVAGGDEDGLLTAGEIMTLKLNADWVILSACNTAAAAGEGAEAISGLGQAFFYAGTRALLVSLWPVETSSARELTTRLFEAQSVDAGLSRSAALRSSMLQLIDGSGMVDAASGRTIASYAHPFFWAPFILVGDN